MALSLDEVLAAVARELTNRRLRYALLVRAGQMDATVASYEIACLQEAYRLLAGLEGASHD